MIHFVVFWVMMRYNLVRKKNVIRAGGARSWDLNRGSLDYEPRVLPFVLWVDSLAVLSLLVMTSLKTGNVWSSCHHANTSCRFPCCSIILCSFLKLSTAINHFWNYELLALTRRCLRSVIWDKGSCPHRYPTRIPVAGDMPASTYSRLMRTFWNLALKNKTKS
jgi:hypothetical protein